MNRIHLAELTEADGERIAGYRAAFPADRARVTPDPDRIPGLDHLEQFESIPAFLKFCRDMRGRITWYLSVRETDGKIVGAVCLRHSLEYDDDDMPFSSHIGYSVRPDERGKGYGREQMRLALEKARQIGLERVRLVCSDTNKSSAGIILSNGGVFIDAVHGEESGLTVNRYDIDLSEEKNMGEIRVEETPLTETVLAELIALSGDWESENSCYGYRANQREDFLGNRIFLARDGERIVGYLYGHVFRSQNMRSIMPEGTPCFEAEELYVIPSMRSRGIGKKLFENVSKAVSDEAEYIILSTATKNWKAVFHFYLDELDMTFWSARLFKRIG